MTAELGRRRAIDLIALAKNGGDPGAERAAERKAKPSTQAEYKRSVELFINPFFRQSPRAKPYLGRCRGAPRLDGARPIPS
jgi:hypothetical protein